MAIKSEKINLEKVDTPPISEEVQIAQKLEEAMKADPSLRKRLDNDHEKFEKVKEEVRQELREEEKKAHEEAILKKLEEMSKEDPSLKESWEENPEEFEKVKEEISEQLWKAAEAAA